MFKRILIANRGEIAVRVFRACRELDIEPVVVYSEADREALHVQLAEHAYCIGPAPSAQSYLNTDAILTVAKGRTATPSIPATASSPRTPSSPRSARTTASPSSAPPPTSSAPWATRPPRASS